MREIKFRGFDKINNKWEIGYLAKASGHLIITDLHWTNGVKFVSEETVGQFTGLHDNNGKEIYEGDIVRLGYFKYEKDGEDLQYTNREIFFREGTFWVEGMFEVHHIDDCEVIGNIHENKNLLGGN